MSATESRDARDARPVADMPARHGRALGAAALSLGLATVVLAFATPYRAALASAVFAAFALVASVLGLVARRQARRAGERPPTAAMAGIWLGVAGLAIIGISVLPALLMPTAAALPG